MSKCKNFIRKVRRFFVHDIYVEVKAVAPFQLLDGKTVIITGGGVELDMQLQKNV